MCQKAADHLVQTIDGKQKEFETSNYANVKNLLKNIQKSNYFDKADQPTTTDITETADENGDENGDIDDNVDEQSNNQTNNTVDAEPNTTNPSVVQQTLASVHTENHEVFTEQAIKIEAPSASALPVPTFAPAQIQPTISQQQQQPQPQQAHGIPAPGMNAAINVKTIPHGLLYTILVFRYEFMSLRVDSQQFLIITASPVPMAAGAIPLAVQVPPAAHPIPAGIVQATTVRAVEQAYFKQHQFVQQMRPLAEVLGAGHFHFLQDSELDSPDVPNNNNNAQQIGVRYICPSIIHFTNEMSQIGVFSFVFLFTVSNHHPSHLLSSQSNNRNKLLVIKLDRMLQFERICKVLLTLSFSFFLLLLFCFRI